MASGTPPHEFPPPDPPDENKTVEVDKNDTKTVILYKNTDKPPYEVYIQNENKNLGNFHLLSIAREIFNLKLEDIVRINKKGKNRIGVIFKNFQAANKFILNKELKEKGYEIFIPTHNISCKGLVRFVDKSITDIELIDFSETNIAACQIINVKRFNRRVTVNDNEYQYIPTGTVCFTFTGRHIPAEISIYHLPMKVIPYVGPVVQCHNCLLYGHTAKMCRGKAKCKRCGRIHDEKEPCLLNCIHCKSNAHESTFKMCPEFERQKNIKETMAFANKSYYEASLLVPKIQKSSNTNIINEDNFPSLVGKEPENIIPIHQRRAATLIDSKKTQSYSQITQYNTKKRKTNSIGKEYDKEGHNACVHNPNGRTPNSTPTTSGYNWERNQKDKMINQDFTKIMTVLSESQKELIMNFIGSLLSNNIQNYQSDKNKHLTLSQDNNINMELSDESEY